MDWDETRPLQQRQVVVGEPLHDFSIEELRERVAALKAEILRVEAELKNMLDSGCRLRALKLVTDNPAGIAAGLASVGADELVEIADLSAGAETSKQPAVEAIIETPAGVVTLA